VEADGNQNTEVEGKTVKSTVRIHTFNLRILGRVFSHSGLILSSLLLHCGAVCEGGGGHVSADEDSALGLFLIAVRSNVRCEVWLVAN
jgi:hypothetical protein